MSFVDYSTVVLRSQGYKVTEPRKRVLQALEQAAEPVSPQDIQRMVGKHGRHLDRVTVYRVLELLCCLNLAHRVMSLGGFVRCSLPREEGCHRLLVCRQCGSLEEFRDEGLCRRENEIAHGLGFQAEHRLTESSGLCVNCQ